eukprot:15454574-Alexandrium_andersonii.AAC.1
MAGVNGVGARLLGKPKNYDGSAEGWGEWSFVLSSYMGLVDVGIPALMRQRAERDDPIDVTRESPTTQQRSTTLFYTLVMLCTGPAQVE